MQTLCCEGEPRALGLDQGHACASAIRAWLSSRGLRVRPRALPTLRRLTGGATLGAGVGREVVRHYPHLVERMSGLARAARVPLESLMDDVVASAYGESGHPLSAPAVAVGVRDSGDATRGVIARAFAPELPWIVRRSRPEIGFASVEITLPWLAGGLAGVNEAGLAAVVAMVPSTPTERGLAAAPAWLLVQECLQRFDGLDASLGWCLCRPCAGEFSLLLGDSHGEFAVVDVASGGSRLRQRGPDSVLAGGGAASETALRKRFAEAERFAADWLRCDDPSARQAAQVWLRPTSGELEWRAPASDPLIVRASSD
jgi:hypothetical protein